MHKYNELGRIAKQRAERELLVDRIDAFVIAWRNHKHDRERRKTARELERRGAL